MNHKEQLLYNALGIPEEDFKSVVNVHKKIVEHIRSFTKQSEYIEFIQNEIEPLNPTQKAILVNILCMQILKMSSIRQMFGMMMCPQGSEDSEEGEKNDPSYA